MNLSDIPKKTQKKILLGLIAALALVGVLYLVALPMVRNRREQKVELDDLTVKIKKANDLIEQKSELSDMLRAKEETLSTIEKQMIPPTENTFLWATERLTTYSRRSGIELDSINEAAVTPPSWDVGKDNSRYFIPYRVKIDFKSGYADLKHFISKIEAENRFVSISSISISADPASPAAHRINLVVEWPLPGKNVKKSIADILAQGSLNDNKGGRR